MKIRYTVEIGEFTKADIDDNQALCDSLLFASVEIGEEMASTMWSSIHKDGKPMRPIHVFSQWGLLANALSRDPGISNEAREVCRRAFLAIQKIATDWGPIEDEDDQVVH